MNFTQIILFSFTIFYTFSFTFTRGADIDVTNKCPYTVWAAASPGGGKRLETGQTWKVQVQTGIAKAHIWGRTGCTFDANGKGKCDTGDCGGTLECNGLGAPPNTVAELIPSQSNGDFMDMSVIDGFNIPMEFGPVGGASCKTIRCAADINGECPEKLRTKGGCNNACKVFNNEQYCCPVSTCEPNEYSKFFKERCPDTYTYPNDDQTGLFTCPGGTNYKVVFCP